MSQINSKSQKLSPTESAHTSTTYSEPSVKLEKSNESKDSTSEEIPRLPCRNAAHFHYAIRQESSLKYG